MRLSVLCVFLIVPWISADLKAVENSSVSEISAYSDEGPKENAELSNNLENTTRSENVTPNQEAKENAEISVIDNTTAADTSAHEELTKRNTDGDIASDGSDGIPGHETEDLTPNIRRSGSMEYQAPCGNAAFFLRVLYTILPLIQNEVPQNLKTSYVLNILANLLQNSPDAPENQEVVLKIKDLLHSLGNYNPSNMYAGAELFKVANNDVYNSDAYKANLVFNHKIPQFDNQNCTMELLKIIKVVRHAIARLISHPACKSRISNKPPMVTSNLDTFSTNHGLNPSKFTLPHLILSSKNQPNQPFVQIVPDSQYPGMLPNNNVNSKIKLTPKKLLPKNYWEVQSYTGRPVYQGISQNSLVPNLIYQGLNANQIPNDYPYDYASAPNYQPSVKGFIDKPSYILDDNGNPVWPQKNSLTLLSPFDTLLQQNTWQNLHKNIPDVSQRPSPEQELTIGSKPITYSTTHKPNSELEFQWQTHPHLTITGDKGSAEVALGSNNPKYQSISSPLEVIGDESSVEVPLGQKPKPLDVELIGEYGPHEIPIGPNQPDSEVDILSISSKLSPLPLKEDDGPINGYIGLKRPSTPLPLAQGDKASFEVQFEPNKQGNILINKLPSNTYWYKEKSKPFDEIKINDSDEISTGTKDTSNIAFNFPSPSLSLPPIQFVQDYEGNDEDLSQNTPNKSSTWSPLNKPTAVPFVGFPLDIKNPIDSIQQDKETPINTAYQYGVLPNHSPLINGVLQQKEKPYLQNASNRPAVYPLLEFDISKKITPVRPDNLLSYYAPQGQKDTYYPYYNKLNPVSQPLLNGKLNPSLLSDNLQPKQFYSNISKKIIPERPDNLLSYYAPQGQKDTYYPYYNKLNPVSRPLINGNLNPLLLTDNLQPKQFYSNIPKNIIPERPDNLLSYYAPQGQKDTNYPYYNKLNPVSQSLLNGNLNPLLLTDNLQPKQFYSNIPKQNIPERPDNLLSYYAPQGQKDTYYPYYNKLNPVSQPLLNGKLNPSLLSDNLQPKQFYSNIPKKYIPERPANLLSYYAPQGQKGTYYPYYNKLNPVSRPLLNVKLNPSYLTNNLQPKQFHSKVGYYKLPKQDTTVPYFGKNTKNELISLVPGASQRYPILLNKYSGIINHKAYNNIPYETNVPNTGNENYSKLFPESEQGVKISTDKNILNIIKDNVAIIEQKVPKLYFNVMIRDLIKKIRELTNLQQISVEQYIGIIKLYERLIENIKHLNISKEIIKDLLLSMTNGVKLELLTGKPNVIELTYLVKRPTPVVYQPFYYIKYRLPYSSVITQLGIILKKPNGSKDLFKLYEEIVAKSKLAEVSPDLKAYGIDEIRKLTFNNGTLVGAQVVKDKDFDKDMYNTLQKIKEINIDFSVDDIYKFISELDMDLKSDSWQKNYTDEKYGYPNTEMNISKQLSFFKDNPSESIVFTKVRPKMITSRKLIARLLNQINNIFSEVKARHAYNRTKNSLENYIHNNNLLGRSTNKDISTQSEHLNIPNIQNMIKRIKDKLKKYSQYGSSTENKPVIVNISSHSPANSLKSTEESFESIPTIRGNSKYFNINLVDLNRKSPSSTLGLNELANIKHKNPEELLKYHEINTNNPTSFLNISPIGSKLLYKSHKIPVDVDTSQQKVWKNPEGSNRGIELLEADNSIPAQSYKASYLIIPLQKVIWGIPVSPSHGSKLFSESILTNNYKPLDINTLEQNDRKNLRSSKEFKFSDYPIQSSSKSNVSKFKHTFWNDPMFSDKDSKFLNTFQYQNYKPKQILPPSQLINGDIYSQYKPAHISTPQQINWNDRVSSQTENKASFPIESKPLNSAIKAYYDGTLQGPTSNKIRAFAGNLEPSELSDSKQSQNYTPVDISIPPQTVWGSQADSFTAPNSFYPNLKFDSNGVVYSKSQEKNLVKPSSYSVWSDLLDATLKARGDVTSQQIKYRPKPINSHIKISSGVVYPLNIQKNYPDTKINDGRS